MHEELPSTLNVPTPHGSHSALAVEEDVPAGQSVVAFAPVAFTKLPASANLQELEPASSA